MRTEQNETVANQQEYEKHYEKEEVFLRYPADWVVRFHNMYMKAQIPGGRVLDYGCGGGNNSVFFIDKGYETYGVDTAPSALSLIKKNLQSKHLDVQLARRFSTISPTNPELPFENNFFDFILSNQVLYYLPTKEYIQKVCQECARVLRPGGVVFFTMMGPRNCYIAEYTKNVINKKVHEVAVNKPGHRLDGVREFIYLVDTEEELKDLFSAFHCLSTGYFDQKMLDMSSNFHWIYIGQKKT